LKSKHYSCKLILNASGNVIFEQSTSSSIEEWPHKWLDDTPDDGKPRVITWKLVNNDGDLPDKIVKKAIKQSLLMWRFFIKDLRFKEERGSGNADFMIHFKETSHMKENLGILAIAYFPGQGEISGDVFINPNFEWSKRGGLVNGVYTYNLRAVLKHEFGHSLGLRHNPDCLECIMYPMYKETDVLLPAPNDIARIRTFYNTASFSKAMMKSLWARLFRKL